MNKVDPIIHYLLSSGYSLKPYYFLDSDWQIGHQVQLGKLQVAFRTEGDTVIICDLISTGHEPHLNSDMARFLRFARKVVALPGVQRVKGMILDQVGSAAELAKRSELAELLIKQGATQVIEEGRRWLVLEKQQSAATLKNS